MHRTHVELEKLRHIVELARVRSYVQAAETLHLSQPALSRSIQSVERHLGVRLFDRDRSGVRPTLAGLELVRRAEALLRDSGELLRSVSDLVKGGQARLAFGMAPALAHAYLSRLSVDLLRESPKLNLHVPISPGTELMAQLLAGTIEFFVATVQTVPDWHIHLQAQPLSRLAVIAAVRAGHPLIHSPAWEADSASDDYPLIAYAEPGSGVLPLAALARGFDVATADQATLLRLVLERDAIWIVPRCSVQQELAQGTLVILPTLEPLHAQAAAMVLKSRTLSPLAQRVIAHLREVMRD